MQTTALARLPVLVAGVRTAFLDSAGAYADLMSYQLAAHSIAALVQRYIADPQDIELVTMGTVLHEVNTTNVARESMLAAGLPSSIPAYTVAMAGISPSVGLANLCDMIALGRVQLGIAGGTDNFSDVPIRLSQNIRRTVMKARQNKTLSHRLKLLNALRLSDLRLELPSSSDFTTQLSMGQACEAMVAQHAISREACDAFAAQSHARAIAATAAQYYQTQIAPMQIGGEWVRQDNTARADATIERLAQLKPVFDPQGVITAGNASRFSDGAGALLVSSWAKAEQLGLPLGAVMRDYQWVGVQDLRHEMLLGSALSIPRLLQRNQLSFEDIAVWEIHEAFAAQLLVNLKCLASQQFVAQRFGQGYPYGQIPSDRLNLWGGSLALGNPFAATGIRLFQTAIQRLKHANQRYAVVSTCAGGGLGAAYLLENTDYIR